MKSTPLPSGLFPGHPSSDALRLGCTSCPMTRFWPLLTADMIELAGCPVVEAVTLHVQALSTCLDR